MTKLFLNNLKNDIENREDIYLIIKDFYLKLLIDDLLIHFFEEIVSKNHLDTHLETVTDFWNGVLFNDTTYQRNAMEPHLLLNKKSPFKKEHFKKWLYHFNTSIDDNFKGTKAEMAKTRALSIATVMEIKMINS